MYLFNVRSQFVGNFDMSYDLIAADALRNCLKMRASYTICYFVCICVVHIKEMINSETHCNFIHFYSCIYISLSLVGIFQTIPEKENKNDHHNNYLRDSRIIKGTNKTETETKLLL